MSKTGWFEISLASLNQRPLFLPILAGTIGTLSFGILWWTIGLSIFLPVLLCQAKNKKHAFLIALFYQAGASRDLPLAVAKFYDHSLILGLGLWLLGNSLVSLVYGLLWQKNYHRRVLSILLGVLLTAVPPLGVIGWANPLIAAGVLFPGTQIFGLLCLLGLYLGFVSQKIYLIAGLLFYGVWSNFSYEEPSKSPIQGMSTLFHRTEDGGIKDFSRQATLIHMVRRADQEAVLLPETMVSGTWTEISTELWQRKLGSEKTVVIGANVYGDLSDTGFVGVLEPNQLKDLKPRQWNALVILDKKSQATYIQRQPIPLAMWVPFSQQHYGAAWFKNPTVELRGIKTAPLICYESFLVWPIVHSYLSGAQQIVAVGNFWWTHGQGIPKIQRSIINSWSRLFHLPYTLAVNL